MDPVGVEQHAEVVDPAMPDTDCMVISPPVFSGSPYFAFDPAGLPCPSLASVALDSTAFPVSDVAFDPGSIPFLGGHACRFLIADLEVLISYPLHCQQAEEADLHAGYAADVDEGAWIVQQACEVLIPLVFDQVVDIPR